MAHKKINFHIGGMHCASCVVTIEGELKKLPGIKSVRVNFADEQAHIEYDEKTAGIDIFRKLLDSLGYSVIETDDRSDELLQLEKKKELERFKKKLIISIICTIPVVIGTMVPFAPEFLKNGWLLWLLATPVQFWVGGRFYKSAWKSFLNHNANMDTLIALGTSVAYFYSVILLFFKSSFEAAGISTHSYFDSSVVIITFILLGKYLEMRAKARTSEAIRELMGLQVKVATVQREQDGTKKWVEIPIEEVVVDDVILIKPGDTIPVDGKLLQGSSLVDQSTVTGESVPVEKKEGDIVIGATINVSGSFQMKATKVGKHTLLAKIIELVRNAQSSKAPIQNIVDKISSYFVPIVIILSLITFLIWYNIGPYPQFLYALMSMISVLIIACPCALGLATPTSLMAGIGRGAKEGILIKDAQTLEIAGKVNVMVLDKTGTLTMGRPEVQHLGFIDNLSEYAAKIGIKEKNNHELYFLSCIVSVENLSRHPFSQAVVRAYGQKVPLKEVTDFESVSGFGIKGKVDGHVVVIGTKKLLANEGIKTNSFFDDDAEKWSKEACTVSYVAIDGENIALIGVSDPIRPEAFAAIQKLKTMHIKPIMLTGDNKNVAQAIAEKLNIKDYVAEVLPQDKERYVQKEKKEGNVVAMVGDGINDAPALAASDVGIAMGEGTDVAIETAGVTLLKSDSSLIPKVISLSKATIRNIRQNLVWAFGYNIVLIPVAMGILYPLFGITLNPMLAGAAMAFSSVSVVLNALRLKRIKL